MEDIDDLAGEGDGVEREEVEEEYTVQLDHKPERGVDEPNDQTNMESRVEKSPSTDQHADSKRHAQEAGHAPHAQEAGHAPHAQNTRHTEYSQELYSEDQVGTYF